MHLMPHVASRRPEPCDQSGNSDPKLDQYLPRLDPSSKGLMDPQLSQLSSDGSTAPQDLTNCNDSVSKRTTSAHLQPLPSMSAFFANNTDSVRNVVQAVKLSKGGREINLNDDFNTIYAEYTKDYQESTVASLHYHASFARDVSKRILGGKLCLAMVTIIVYLIVQTHFAEQMHRVGVVMEELAVPKDLGQGHSLFFFFLYTLLNVIRYTAYTLYPMYVALNSTLECAVLCSVATIVVEMCVVVVAHLDIEDTAALDWVPTARRYVRTVGCLVLLPLWKRAVFMDHLKNTWCVLVGITLWVVVNVYPDMISTIFMADKLIFICGVCMVVVLFIYWRNNGIKDSGLLYIVTTLLAPSIIASMNLQLHRLDADHIWHVKSILFMMLPLVQKELLRTGVILAFDHSVCSGFGFPIQFFAGFCYAMRLATYSIFSSSYWIELGALTATAIGRDIYLAKIRSAASEKLLIMRPASVVNQLITEENRFLYDYQNSVADFLASVMFCVVIMTQSLIFSLGHFRPSDFFFGLSDRSGDIYISLLGASIPILPKLLCFWFVRDQKRKSLKKVQLRFRKTCIQKGFALLLPHVHVGECPEGSGNARQSGNGAPAVECYSSSGVRGDIHGDAMVDTSGMTPFALPGAIVCDEDGATCSATADSRHCGEPVSRRKEMMNSRENDRLLIGITDSRGTELPDGQSSLLLSSVDPQTSELADGQTPRLHNFCSVDSAGLGPPDVRCQRLLTPKSCRASPGESVVPSTSRLRVSTAFSESPSLYWQGTSFAISSVIKSIRKRTSSSTSAVSITSSIGNISVSFHSLASEISRRLSSARQSSNSLSKASFSSSRYSVAPLLYCISVLPSDTMPAPSTCTAKDLGNPLASADLCTHSEPPHMEGSRQGATRSTASWRTSIAKSVCSLMSAGPAKNPIPLFEHFPTDCTGKEFTVEIPRSMAVDIEEFEMRHLVLFSTWFYFCLILLVPFAYDLFVENMTKSYDHKPSL
eukprot:GEMP01002605.1.p1 GENE.GEMP01002605.1~~GEMP01002605.1.p1  ORF type:complete len:990 (+),score=122.04 GEMP01002605.1:504-3473(+)